MKAITIYSLWDDNDEKIKELGELVVEIDESEDYEQDASRLYKKGRKYTLLDSNGCSCWDGDWEGWTDLTLTELRKLGKSWAKDEYSSSKAMGEWIKENM